MALLPGIEQRYLNPQTGPLDTILPDATVNKSSVLVFNIGDVNSVTVRCQGGQTINDVPTYTVTSKVSVLFISDGLAWRTHDGARTTNNLNLGARVFRSTNAGIGTGAITALSFNSTRYDTDGMFTTANATRLTVKTAGKYAVGGTVEFVNAAGAIRILDVRLNGTTILARQTVTPLGGGFVTEMTVATIYDLVVGDFLELTVFQDSGGPININSVGNYSPEFWCHRLGDQASSGVATSRRINTVAPLAGGGSLAADLTLSITFPGGTTDFLRADGVFATPTAAVALTTVEVSLGAAPSATRSGKFTIAGVGLVIGKPVSIQQASGPYTGKGARNDEAEMDQVLVVGKVISAIAIECFWKSQHRVRGNFKFNYLIGV